LQFATDYLLTRPEK